MTYYYCYLAYKDESTSTSTPGTITASMINLKPSPSTLSRRTETLNHHHQTSNNKGFDAVSIKNESERTRIKKKDLLRHIVVSTCIVTLHSSIINIHIHNRN